MASRRSSRPWAALAACAALAGAALAQPAASPMAGKPPLFDTGDPPAPPRVMLFDTGEPPAKPIPTHAVRDAIGELDSRLGDLNTKAGEAADPQVLLAIRCAVRVRQVARALLAAADDKAATSEAAALGLLLAHGAKDFDEFFKKLPLKARELAQNADAPLEEYRKLDRLESAMARFAAGRLPPGAEGRRISAREFACRELAPLLPALEAADEPAPRSCWLPPAPRAGGAPPSEPSRESLEALASRYTALVPKLDGAKAAAPLLAQVIAGLKHVDFQPRVDEAFHLLAGAAATLEPLAAGDAPPALDAALRAALEGYSQPARREDAARALRRLAALAPSARAVAELKAKGVAAGPYLAGLAAAALQALGPDKDRKSLAIQLRLDMVVRSVQQRRDMKAPAALGDLTGVHNEHMRLYDAAEAAAADQLAKLGQSPEAFASPEVGNAINELRKALVNVKSTARFAGWMEELEPFRPQPPTAIADRLKKSIRRLNDKAQGEASFAEVAAFADQLDRLRQLPGEAQLKALAAKPDPGDAAMLGVTVDRIAKGIDRRKTAWAATWAAGKPPAEGEAVVRALERITPAFAAVIYRARMGDDPGPMVFNRWPGWEAPAAATKKITDYLDTWAQTAATLIVSGRGDQIAADLARMESEMPFALVYAMLVMELGDRVRALPTGVSGVLSQACFSPSGDALLGGSSEDLATIVRCVHELAKGEAESNDAVKASLAEHGNWLLRRIEARRREGP